MCYLLSFISYHVTHHLLTLTRIAGTEPHFMQRAIKFQYKPESNCLLTARKRFLLMMHYINLRLLTYLTVNNNLIH